MADSELLVLTERAADKIKGFLDAEGDGGRALRFRVVRTHCMGGRGHAYDLRASEGPSEGDEVVEAHGVRLLVDPASARVVKGTEIDYAESLETSGFAITNPNATGKCPCGHHDLFE